jgi:thiamine biosynthesis lipoprotein
VTVHRFRSMGCDIAVAGDNAEQVEQLFHDYDRRFTRFRDDSELARVNRSAGPVLVSDEFARAVRVALRAFRQTDGLVSPFVAQALEASGYDRDFAELARSAAAPAPSLAIDVRVPSLQLVDRLLTKSARLDLNGVVKSLAVDDALKLVSDGWVSAGGDLATTRPVEVALPRGGSVRLESGALATSGADTRRWMQDGVERHHLIDPRTGAPAESPWEQVTVCGATCVDADVAAKAAFLMGDDGPAWLGDHGIPGRFVRADGSVVVNRRWPCT